MRKILSILLCLTLMLGMLPTFASVNASAAQYDEISANSTYTISWGSSVESKYVYLEVDQTGYYDMSITDNYEYATLDFSFYDLNLADASGIW